jgi:transmembrane sensor
VYTIHKQKIIQLEEDKLYRFFKGKSTRKEAREIVNWIYSQKSEPEVNDLIETYWHNAATEDADWNANASWQEFMNELNMEPVNPDAKILKHYDEIKRYRDEQLQSSRKRWIYKIAASISFLVLISFALYQVSNNFSAEGISQTATVENISKTTGKGQKLTIFLKDGTKVILNAESEIIYPKFFNDTDRTVELKGEAFFEVTRDENIPFRVLSNQTVTEVLGTSFNIESDLEGQKVKVALVSGKVKVNILNDQKSTANFVELNPGEAAFIDHENLRVNTFDYNSTVLWKEGILFFDKAGFNTIIKELESWYGVDIEIHGSTNLDKKHYSGKFDNESLQNVLESIGFSKDFNYKITDKKVILNIK